MHRHGNTGITNSCVHSSVLAQNGGVAKTTFLLRIMGTVYLIDFGPDSALFK